MNKIIQKNHQLKCLLEILSTFFALLGKNKHTISSLLNEMRLLRKEYSKFLSEDFMKGLIQDKGDGSVGNLSLERLGTLLEKLLVSFKADQERSYEFVQEKLYKDVLQNVVEEALAKGIKEIEILKKSNTELKDERNKLQNDKNELENLLNKEKSELSDLLEITSQKNKDLNKSKIIMQEKIRKLTKEVNQLKSYREADEDYKTMISEIRKELEGKKNLDFWRLKVLYNKVAATTNSSFEYPGVPKPDSYIPKSEHVKKFLESL